MSTEIAYVALLFTLFVVPRLLQRFRIPSALSALLFGVVAAMIPQAADVLQHDQTVALLSTLGIVTLFLFAGLDVDVKELRREAKVITEHVTVRVLVLAPAAWAIVKVFGLDVRPALLVALALLTPSTGFILDSLSGWGLTDREQFWVRSKAIATELVALLVLFVVLQSTSAGLMTISAAAIILMIAVLPVVFRWFASVVTPYAPKSEFGFLVMVAVICALVTRHLGVYYLVGAFVVGMSAEQLHRTLPAAASDRILGAVEAFASIFVPFYFFHAGLQLSREYFGWWAILTGVAFVVVVLPFSVGLMAGHRAVRLRESMRGNLRITVPLLPTTVFTLVLVEILRTRFDAPAYLLGGLIFYMFINTLLPSLVLRAPTPEFQTEKLYREALNVGTTGTTGATGTSGAAGVTDA